MLKELIAHARAVAPEECCGLIGTSDGKTASSMYPMRNVAKHPRTAYEVAPSDLFSVQREIRARSETLLAIYHSHPASDNPEPSETDLRLAYYPDAFYIIIGLQNIEKVRGFEIGGAGAPWTEATLETVSA